MNEKRLGNCEHHPWVEDGTVCMNNDDDGYYVQEFNSREEVEAFIAELRKCADEAFGG